MDHLINLHSQKALLHVLDLVVVVMMNSEKCEAYIQRIMELSE